MCSSVACGKCNVCAGQKCERERSGDPNLGGRGNDLKKIDDEVVAAGAFFLEHVVELKCGAVCAGVCDVCGAEHYHVRAVE